MDMQNHEDLPFAAPYFTISRIGGDIQVAETTAHGTTRIIKRDEPDYPFGIDRSFGVGVAAPAATSPSPAPRPAGGDQSQTYLNVPFQEKDAAKAAGARWDATRKKWYVPSGRDINLFGKWLPQDLF